MNGSISRSFEAACTDSSCVVTIGCDVGDDGVHTLSVVVSGDRRNTDLLRVPVDEATAVAAVLQINSY